MILTKQNHLARYLGIHPNLDTALHYIMDEDLSLLPNGTTVIDGEQVFVNHFQYTTQPASFILEAHEHYADIHVPLSGEEYIGCCDISSAIVHTPYEPSSDSCLYHAEVLTYSYVNNEHIAITFQEDAHEPKIMTKNPETIDKLVFKVRM